MRGRRRLWAWLGVLGPGVLVAATGVGAGDLATAGFAGSKLGVAILWAVVLGAFLKFVLTEGLTRWQLATRRTLLEGAVDHFGWPVLGAFLIYLLVWSFFTGGALISAGGAAAGAIVPLIEDEDTSKLVFGATQSAIALLLAMLGGFKVFERVMSVCVGIMFVAVVVTAIRLATDWSAIASGLVVPRIPDMKGEGLVWTIALMGGVGGTVTVLCYGYWIRELGRDGPEALRACRLDLASGYIMTGLFGLAMVVIASGVQTPTGSGVGLIVGLGDQIGSALGPGARRLFLVGVWSAVFSSMLGVWQAVPYLFADFVELLRERVGRTGAAGRPTRRASVSTRSMTYRGFALAIATIPLAATQFDFADVQKYYAVMGAAFIPALALALLVLNGRRKWVGPRLRNHPITALVLVIALALSVAAGTIEVRKRWAAAERGTSASDRTTDAPADLGR